MGMCSQNEHTRQLQKTKAATAEYRSNYDRIFKKDYDKAVKIAAENLMQTIDAEILNKIAEEASGEKQRRTDGKAEPAS